MQINSNNKIQSSTLFSAKNANQIKKAEEKSLLKDSSQVDIFTKTTDEVDKKDGSEKPDAPNDAETQSFWGAIGRGLRGLGKLLRGRFVGAAVEFRKMADEIRDGKNGEGWGHWSEVVDPNGNLADLIGRNGKPIK